MKSAIAAAQIKVIFAFRFPYPASVIVHRTSRKEQEGPKRERAESATVSEVGKSGPTARRRTSDVRSDHGKNEVVEPVGSGGEGNAVRSHANRELLGGDDPSKRS